MSDPDRRSLAPPPPPPPPAPCALCGTPRGSPAARCPECGLYPGLAAGDPDPLDRSGVTMIIVTLVAIYLVVFGIVAATS